MIFQFEEKANDVLQVEMNPSTDDKKMVSCF